VGIRRCLRRTIMGSRVSYNMPAAPGSFSSSIGKLFKEANADKEISANKLNES